MYDQSFNLKSIERTIRKSDFYKLHFLKNEAEKAKVISSAHTRSIEGFKDFSAFSSNKIRGKTVVSVKSFSDELLVRKINLNIVTKAKIRPLDRDSIVANVGNLLAEGVQYRVYRLDIKSFYETISASQVTAALDDVASLSLATKQYVQQILRHYHSSGGSGVPRGLSISGALSELVLRNFDRRMTGDSEVFFYSRYVDDIIIITSGDENRRRFTRWIRSSLPAGLSLNEKKQHIIERAKVIVEKGAPSIPKEVSFEFLGYEFKVIESGSDGKKPRIVKLDLAPSKVKKIKTRLLKSLLSYTQDKDFDLLSDRILFLCSNFSVMDADRERKRLAGIYHNYHRVLPGGSDALRDLELFFQKVVSSGYGRVCDPFFTSTTASQRRELLRYSFIRGHSTPVYYHFSEKRISKIQRCWRYV